MAVAIDLSGRAALVTGGSRGIGRSIAMLLGRAGAAVAVSGRSPDAVASTVAAIRHECCVAAAGVVGDVVEPEGARRTVEGAVQALGRLDIVVNNAGGASGPVQLEEITAADWDAIVNLNLRAAFLCSQAAVPYLRESRGRIININSRAGRSTSRFGGASYTSAKAGLLGLTRHLAEELAPYGVLVNGVGPGLVLSGERAEARWQAQPEARRLAILSEIPLRRPAKPDEIAGAVLFLASDLASYITGITIDVNGGRFMT